jgi:branched-chain amino acid transport system ATP-binding protein
MTKSSNADKPVLILEQVCKRFGGVIAADEVSLELRSGEICGLIGPNGSGKTTLLNLITGIYPVDSGKISILGKNITKELTYNRARKGIVRTFQHPRLLGRCDIRTNMLLGVDLATMRKAGDEAEGTSLMDRLLIAAGMDSINLSDSIEKLSYGQQKLLEIVRAILSRPVVLLLDEPAAGLNLKEMDFIIELIEIAIEKGVAVLLIEHSMDLVMSLCDWITVLNFGRQIATGIPEDIQCDPVVIEAYLGVDRNARN